jgi:hypothetical protein
VLAAEVPAVRIAVGEPATGLDGFIASDRQATAAHEVGSAAGEDVGAVFPYREVSSLAFLCADIPRARAWVAETLGELAVARTSVRARVHRPAVVDKPSRPARKGVVSEQIGSSGERTLVRFTDLRTVLAVNLVRQQSDDLCI